LLLPSLLLAVSTTWRCVFAANQATTAAELSLRHQSKDVGVLRSLGYELESLDPATSLY
jgi:hypothetical protein